MTAVNLTQLSRVCSHALRHEPWLYELELDEQGWVPTIALLAALREERAHWSTLTADDLARMVETSDKKRYEMKDGRIRALYGHSTPHKLLKQPGTPPTRLYHGTSPETLPAIQRDGLRPMSRQYVHLSVHTDMARQVGGRKATAPMILIIDAERAHAEGVAFYRGNDLVWLADHVPPAFIAPARDNS